MRFGPNTMDQNSFVIVHYGVGCVYSSSASVSSIALFGAGREGCAAVEASVHQPERRFAVVRSLRTHVHHHRRRRGDKARLSSPSRSE